MLRKAKLRIEIYENYLLNKVIWFKNIVLFGRGKGTKE